MKNRYSRQELFLGKEAQEKITNSRVFILGAGALGSSSAEMLARAGVGHITIVDRDYVEWSNLQRQHLFSEEHAEKKMPKAFAAKERLEEINSGITIQSLISDVHGLNIEEIVKGHDVIIDATDNFEIRLIANDAAVKHSIPFVMGACVASYGTTFTVRPGETPCLHCLLNHLPFDGMTCETVGVISPIVQIITAHQVTQVLKILVGEPIKPILKSLDVWKDEHAEIDVSRLKNNQCPTCSDQPTYPYLQRENQTKSDVLCGREAVQIRPSAKRHFILTDFVDSLDGLLSNITINPFLLSGDFDTYRVVFFKDGRAIIHGTNDTKVARTIYNRFINYYIES